MEKVKIIIEAPKDIWTFFVNAIHNDAGTLDEGLIELRDSEAKGRLLSWMATQASANDKNLKGKAAQAIIDADTNVRINDLANQVIISVEAAALPGGISGSVEV
jgi:hypothetical protein